MAFMTKMILVRHCQAEGNLKRFFQGRIDTDITELGAKQTAQTAALLSNEPIDVIYSSPKLRAMKTASGINIYHEVGIITDERLVEINAGEWEGVLLTDIERLYPVQWGKWKNEPSAFHAPGGESMRDVYDRVKSALLDIASENRGKTVCVVSHGCAIMNMMCFLHGLGVEDIGKITLGPNASVNAAVFDDELVPKVLFEGYAEHLQEGNREFF